MRKLISVLLALLLACGLTSALAETRLTVSGTAEVLVPADTAVITVGVTVRDKDALQAQSKANGTLSAVRLALTGAGIAPEDINTGYINLYPVYDYSGETEQIIGYSASSTLAVKVTDLSLAGRVIDLAFGAGANNLEGISFSVSDESEARSAALKAAVTDAGTKAEILAEASGLKITGIELIQEGNTYSYDGGSNRFAVKSVAGAGEEYQPTVVQAAKICVSASVTITYILE